MISLLELFGHHKGRTKEREPKCSQPAESTLLLLQSSSRRNADTAISGTICCCKEYLRKAKSKKENDILRNTMAATASQ